jgi:hypothetical protein
LWLAFGIENGDLRTKRINLITTHVTTAP